MMDVLVPAMGGALGFGGGSLAAAYQHYLYREPQFRAEPARGRLALALRLFLGLCGAVAAALALRPGLYSLGPGLLTAAFAAVLLVLASTDIERRRIPDRLSVPAILAALAFSWAWPDRTVTDVMLGAALGMGVGAGLFLAGVAFGGAAGGLGLGDAKLMLLIGAVVGWPLTMHALLIGMLVAGIPGLVLSFGGRGRSYFSYGPYLVLGALLVLLFPSFFS
jgi:prepilin signal peptidase PulO-like enzyme (type II secretory pathway)